MTKGVKMTRIDLAFVRADELKDVWYTSMPRGARVLSALDHGGTLTVYFDCDPTYPKVPRAFQIVRNLGQTTHMPVNSRFVASVPFECGTIHLFDLGEMP